MTLTEIKQILRERNIRLTKSLGQNFLHDQNQIKRIEKTSLLANLKKASGQLAKNKLHGYMANLKK